MIGHFQCEMIEAEIGVSDYFTIIRCRISKNVDKDGKISFKRLMFISPLYKFERSSENIDDLLSLQVSIQEVIAQDGANVMLADNVLLPLLVIASNIEH